MSYKIKVILSTETRGPNLPLWMLNNQLADPSEKHVV